VDSSNNRLIHHTYTNSHLKHKLVNTDVSNITTNKDSDVLRLRFTTFSRDRSRYACSFHNANDYAVVAVRNTSDHSLVGELIINNGDLSDVSFDDLSGCQYGASLALNGKGDRLAILASLRRRDYETHAYSRVFIKKLVGNSWNDVNDDEADRIFHREPGRGSISSIDLDSTGNTLMVSSHFARASYLEKLHVSQFSGGSSEDVVGAVLIYQYANDKFVIKSGLVCQ
jgi:hypothetical protein